MSFNVGTVRAVALAALFLVQFLPAPPRTHAGENRTILRLYTWSEYFAPDVLATFEETHNCIVAIDTFDSNEDMLERLLASDGDYDIVTPSSYMAEEMRRRNLLTPIDRDLIPNLRHLDAGFAALTGDAAMRFTVPYTRTVTGVGYNAKILGETRQSWDIFARRDLSGRVTMLNDIRETVGAALKYLGHSLNSTDDAHLAEAESQLRRWRSNLATFEVDEANIGLGSGRYVAVHGYNGDLALLMDENPDIDFFVPREGSAITADDFVLLVGSRQRELAHAFINHFLDPGNAAANMADILYYMPVPEAVDMLDDEVKNNHAFTVPEETLAKCEVIRDLGDDTAKFEAVWERVKTGE